MTRTPEDPVRSRMLDTLLAADTVPPPSPGLRRGILLGFEQRAQGGFWRTFWRELGGVRVVVPAFAASLALGIGVAAFLPATGAQLDAVAEVDDAPAYAELALLDGAYEDYLP